MKLNVFIMIFNPKLKWARVAWNLSLLKKRFLYQVFLSSSEIRGSNFISGKDAQFMASSDEEEKKLQKFDLFRF